jgi:hypothetical protein
MFECPLISVPKWYKTKLVGRLDTIVKASNIMLACGDVSPTKLVKQVVTLTLFTPVGDIFTEGTECLRLEQLMEPYEFNCSLLPAPVGHMWV